MRTFRNPVRASRAKTAICSALADPRFLLVWNLQGSHPSTLFCPPLYLSHREADNLGDCAYIVPVYITTAEYDSIRCYIALYFQSELFRNILTENLINDGSLSYITNERDAVLTSSDTNMIGLYYINYDTIRDNLMSSNSFIEREITGNRVFVGFYYIESADWFMVTFSRMSRSF